MVTVIAKARVVLSRKLNRLVLGALIGKMPFTSVRSLEEIYYRKEIRDHITDIIPIHEPSIVKYSFPENYPPHFCREKVFEKRNAFILKDVCVSPRSGLVWFREGYILEESVGSFKRIMLGWDGVLHEPLLPTNQLHVDDQIIGCPPTGYFHWLFERMPILLQALGLVPDARILASERSPKYLLNALGLLLGPEEFKKRVIFAPNPVWISRFIMPQVEIYSGFVRPRDVRQLRSAFKSTASATSTIADEFLYVSRSGTPKRRLANEQELEEELRPLGFSIVHPENMHFQAQIALFSKARFIVAPHGAGLSNIVWADSPCQVLEIFPSDIFNDCYARLAVSLGLKYDYMVCEPDQSSSGRIPVGEVLERITIDMAKKDLTD